MRPEFISGSSAVGFAIGGWAVPIVFPKVDPIVAEGMLWLAIGLIVLAVLMWLWGYRKPVESGDGITQTTHGHHSPTFAHTNIGNLNWNASPPQGAEPQKCPQGPIWGALRHIALVIGDDDEQGCYARARRELRQAALEGDIEIWGRKTIPLVYLSDTAKPSDVWSKIPPQYWEDFKLNSMAVGEAWQDHDHTEAEPYIMEGQEGGKYWSLKVSQRKVNERWRLKAAPKGKPTSPGGPQGWMQ